MEHGSDRRRLSWLVALGICSTLWPNPASAELVPLGPVELEGNVLGDEDLSAVQEMGDFLAIASDETVTLQLLSKRSADEYRVAADLPLLPPDSTELDMEALAADEENLYVLGSHSWARKKARDSKSAAENRERLEQVKFEASRDHLFRLEIDPQHPRPLRSIDSQSLRTLFANHPVLHLFMNVPSKENGIDFEGMAVADGRLFLGLRGPVLNGNFVPVLSFDFDSIEDCSKDFAGHPEECALPYVTLDGRGIRSLHAVDDGFLIIAGPVGDGDSGYRLHFWDGRDCLPDDGPPSCVLEMLGEVPTPPEAKAEGLAVLDESDEAWEILVVYDGVKGGDPQRFRVARP